MELFVLYLWLKLGAIFTALLIATFVCTLILGIITIGVAMDENRLINGFKKYLSALIVAVVILVALPSKTDVAILVGTHYALKAADTPEAAKVMTLLRKKANDMLDEQLNEKVDKK